MSISAAISNLSQEEITFLVKHVRRNKVLLRIDLEDLTKSSFGFVKFRLPELLNNGNIDLLLLETLRDRNVNVFEYEIQQISYSDAIGFVGWIVDELEIISRLEQEHLSSDPDIDMIGAGISDLNQFGDLNTLDVLASGDITKWEDIKKLPYSVVFDKQYKSIIESNIQKRLMKIKESKGGKK